MTAIPGTVVAAAITTGETANTFPTHDANEGKGGIHHVADATARDAIATARKYTGMLAYLISPGRYDQWNGSAWVTDVLHVVPGAGAVSEDASLHGLVRAPIVETIVLIQKSTIAFTIAEFAAKLASGTCTARLKIESTAVTGSSTNFTSTEAAGTCTAANAVAIGDTVYLDFTAISSPVDFSFTMKATRT